MLAGGGIAREFFLGKKCVWNPCLVLCPVQDMSSQRCGLHDGGPALGRIVSHVTVALLPGHWWYGCVDVTSESATRHDVSKQSLYRSETWVCENVGARLSSRQESKQNIMDY